MTKHGTAARRISRRSYTIALTALAAASILSVGTITSVSTSAATLPASTSGSEVSALTAGETATPETPATEVPAPGTLTDDISADATPVVATDPAPDVSADETVTPEQSSTEQSSTEQSGTGEEITAPSTGVTSPATIARPASAAGFAAALNIVMPGATTTGVPIGTQLTRHYGDITITKAGTVIDSLEIFGLVRVEAANVTIKRSLLHGRAVTGSSALIYAGAASVQNLRVEDSELVASSPSPNINGIYGSHFTLNRVNIHGVVDSVHIFGDNVTVQNSWLHNNLHFASDPNFGGGPSHDDNIQIQRGTNLNFVNNTMGGAYNSVMQITQGQGTTSNVNFKNNWISGGACSINVAQAGVVTGPINGLVLYQNVFGSSRFNCQIIIDRGSFSRTVFSGNLTLNSLAAKVQIR